MGTSTNFEIPYPDSTDAPNVPADMQALADKVDLLLSLPDSVSASSSSGNTITSTSYAALPSTPLSVAITNPSADFDMEVDVYVSAWMSSNGTVENTVSVNGTGGMSFAAGSTGNGHALSQGENLLHVDTTAGQHQCVIPVVIPAGAAAVTMAVHAKRNSASGTQLVNFPAIRVVPRRFVTP